MEQNIEATKRGPPACICMRIYYTSSTTGGGAGSPSPASRAGARRASAPRGVAFISFMSTHVRSSRGNPDCCLRQNLWSPVPRVGATAAHTLISATAHYYYSTDALASRARYGISKTNGHSMRSLPASEGSGDVRAAPARRINSACRPRATKHGPAGAPDAPEGPVPPARRWVPLHCSAGTNTPPADSNSRQKHRPDLRARHARAQTKYLTHGRPAAPLETSRSRLPARTAAHHQQTKQQRRTHLPWSAGPANSPRGGKVCAPRPCGEESIRGE